MNTVTKTFVRVRGISYTTFSSPAELTGRWQIIEVDGVQALHIECKYTKEYLYPFNIDTNKESVTEFIPEERLFVQTITEYPIQECCHEQKINYGNPYDPYDQVWKDEDRFNNAMFDIGESFDGGQSPRRIEDTSYEDESPYQSTEEQGQDDASD